MKDLSTIVAAFLIAVGLAASGFFVKCGLDTFHKPEGLVNVKGLVEIPVKADYVVWQFYYEDDGPDLQKATEKSKLSKAAIDRFLAKYNLTNNAKPILPVVMRQETTDTPVRIIVKSGITISSPDVDKVDEAYSASSALLNEGVNFSDAWNSRPRYSYKKFNERRPEFFAKAVQNAREMAERFAKDAGLTLGKVASADQGAFELQSLNGQEDESFSKDKLMRVVSRFSYTIK